MTHSDPIADLLARIKNAYMARHKKVVAPYSKMKEQVVRVMIEEGYLKNVSIAENEGKKALKIALLYKEDKPALTHIKRISKPGLRLYAGRKDIPRILGGLGITILTTSVGIMTGVNAHKKKVGGEIICEIW